MSIVVHVVVIGGAVHQSGIATTAVDPPHRPLIFIDNFAAPVPPSWSSPPRVPPKVPIPAAPGRPISVPLPAEDPAPIALPPLGSPFPSPGEEHGGLATSDDVGDPTSTPTGDRPLGALDVDKAATAAPGSPPPAYPVDLRSAGIEGVARMRYVVDTLGRADAGSIAVVSADDPQFAAAARDAIGRAHYYSAEAGGRKVPQLVEQLFSFRITR